MIEKNIDRGLLGSMQPISKETETELLHGFRRVEDEFSCLLADEKQLRKHLSQLLEYGDGLPIESLAAMVSAQYVLVAVGEVLENYSSIHTRSGKYEMGILYSDVAYGVDTAMMLVSEVAAGDLGANVATNVQMVINMVKKVLPGMPAGKELHFVNVIGRQHRHMQDLFTTDLSGVSLVDYLTTQLVDAAHTPGVNSDPPRVMSFVARGACLARHMYRGVYPFAMEMVG